MPDADVPLFARVLRVELERRSWTLADLARESRMEAPTVWRYLNGERRAPFDAVVQMLAAMGKSLTWLDRQMKGA